VPPLPLPLVVVVVVVVVLVVVLVGAVVLVVDVVGAVVLELVDVVVGAVVTVAVLVSPPPLSEAITTTATTRPMTTATRTAMAHLAPRLMPPVGGGCEPGGGSGWLIWRVGSSCIGGRV
jgi:hypothetical protein